MRAVEVWEECRKNDNVVTLQESERGTILIATEQIELNLRSNKRQQEEQYGVMWPVAKMNVVHSRNDSLRVRAKNDTLRKISRKKSVQLLDFADEIDIIVHNLKIGWYLRAGVRWITAATFWSPFASLRKNYATLIPQYLRL